MKKIITAAALAAFAIVSTSAMAEDTKPNAATQKTPTQQQMDTKKDDAKMAPSGTTGAAPTSGTGSNMQGQGAKVPGKPSDSTKDTTSKQ